MSAISIREQIKAVDDRPEKLVDVPEWDVKLLLIAPTSHQRTKMMTAHYEEVVDAETGETGRMLNTQAMFPSLVVVCSHDPETRTRVFQDGDEEWLGEKNGAVVERLGFDCMPLAGFSQEGDEDGTDSGKGDSSTTPTDATASDSPAPSAAP